MSSRKFRSTRSLARATLVVLAATGALSAQSVHAADVGLTVNAGTTGVGAHLSLPLAPSLNARFGANYLDHSFNASTSDLDYKFKLKLTTFDALLDWFPVTGSEFRLSGGVIYNGNKVDATGTPNGSNTYTINGNTYSASSAGQVDGKIEFRKVAPYIGVGWGNAVAPNKGWGFSADLGVMFQGSARTSLNNSGCTASTPICARLASDVAAENGRLTDKANDYRLFPVVRVGATYRF